MRVATINIRHGADSHGKIRLQEIGEALSQFSADIICMQEVDVNVKRSGSVNQAELLAELTQHVAFFSPAFNYQEGLYGISILAREEHLSAQHMPLPIMFSTSEPSQYSFVSQFLRSRGTS